jgi:hypothetical protein
MAIKKSVVVGEMSEATEAAVRRMPLLHAERARGWLLRESGGEPVLFELAVVRGWLEAREGSCWIGAGLVAPVAAKAASTPGSESAEPAPKAAAKRCNALAGRVVPKVARQADLFG